MTTLPGLSRDYRVSTYYNLDLQFLMDAATRGQPVYFLEQLTVAGLLEMLAVAKMERSDVRFTHLVLSPSDKAVLFELDADGCPRGVNRPWQGVTNMSTQLAVLRAGVLGTLMNMVLLCDPSTDHRHRAFETGCYLCTNTSPYRASPAILRENDVA